MTRPTGQSFFSLQEVHSGAVGNARAKEGERWDRNVILPVAIPTEVRKKLALLPGKPIESKLFA